MNVVESVSADRQIRLVLGEPVLVNAAITKVFLELTAIRTATSVSELL